LNSSIFISKSFAEVAELDQFCQQKGLQLFAESLITFKAVPFKIEQAYDVVFFASIRAAEFFLQQVDLPPSCAIACIGQTTAAKLNALGLHVDFIGEKAGKPEEVANAFKAWLGTRTVLIPQSTVSKRSIASVIDPKHCMEVVVYETLPECKKIPVCGTYVFTSPSNFESFLLCNEVPKGRIIAWGETTKRAVLKHGLGVDDTLVCADMGELVRVLTI
jgi:uroporphyrinogen-III synthase